MDKPGSWISSFVKTVPPASITDGLTGEALDEYLQEWQRECYARARAALQDFLDLVLANRTWMK